jgi:hypothetical protein
MNIENNHVDQLIERINYNDIIGMGSNEFNNIFNRCTNQNVNNRYKDYINYVINISKKKKDGGVKKNNKKLQDK